METWQSTLASHWIVLTLPLFPLYNLRRSNDTFDRREYLAWQFFQNHNLCAIITKFGKWKIIRTSFPKIFQTILQYVFLMSRSLESLNFRRWNWWLEGKGTQERDSRRFYVSWIVRRMNILVHARDTVGITITSEPRITTVTEFRTWVEFTICGLPTSHR